MKQLTLQALLMVIVLTVFFVLVGKRGPLLVALVVLPTLAAMTGIWLVTRRSRIR